MNCSTYKIVPLGLGGNKQTHTWILYRRLGNVTSVLGEVHKVSARMCGGAGGYLSALLGPSFRERDGLGSSSGQESLGYSPTMLSACRRLANQPGVYVMTAGPPSVGFITSEWESDGILPAVIEDEYSDGSARLSIKDKGSGKCRIYCRTKNGWFPNWSAARRDVSSRREKKVSELRRKIHRLMEMRF